MLYVKTKNIQCRIHIGDIIVDFEAKEKYKDNVFNGYAFVPTVIIDRIPYDYDYFAYVIGEPECYVKCIYHFGKIETVGISSMLTLQDELRDFASIVAEELVPIIEKHEGVNE